MFEILFKIKFSRKVLLFINLGVIYEVQSSMNMGEILVHEYMGEKEYPTTPENKF